MLNTSARPSPLPSARTSRQVDGMNCIGPTARSNTGSPSSAPPSVSRISETFARPSSGTPRIRIVPVPSARSSVPPNRPWLDSTRPIAASNVQRRPQDADRAAACL
jgi:hypothetical protein